MSNSNHLESLVLFELAGNTWGVRSRAVQSVELMQHITAVPNSLPFVEGVTIAAGQVIPGINLRIRLGFPEIPVDGRARMLVVRSRDRTAAMLVDSAREFVSISTEAIQSSGKAGHAWDNSLIARFVEGIATLGNRVVLILNIEEVIAGL